MPKNLVGQSNLSHLPSVNKVDATVIDGKRFLLGVKEFGSMLQYKTKRDSFILVNNSGC